MRFENFVAGILLIAAVACAPHQAAIDTGPKPAGVGGTIAGIVRIADSNAPLSGRKVTAINLANGARFEVTTADNGGYTIKVPTGKYRLELELRAGEAIAKQPEETDVNTSDLDPGRDFVVSVRKGL